MNTKLIQATLMKLDSMIIDSISDKFFDKVGFISRLDSVIERLDKLRTRRLIIMKRSIDKLRASLGTMFKGSDPGLYPDEISTYESILAKLRDLGTEYI